MNRIFGGSLAVSLPLLLVFLALAPNAYGKGWHFAGPLPEGVGHKNIGPEKITFRVLGHKCEIGEESIVEFGDGYLHTRKLSCQIDGTKVFWTATHYSNPTSSTLDEAAQFGLSKGSKYIFLSLVWVNK